MEKLSCDTLIIGSGLAGLALALKASRSQKVIVVCKSKMESTNTAMAQGGIAAVMGAEDSFDRHIADTLQAGGGLCRRDVVENIVEQAPERIRDLERWGVHFDIYNEHGENKVDLTKEGGHSKRRILHIEDHTGRDIQRSLQEAVLAEPNIQVISDAFAIDLITDRMTDPARVSAARCIGAYLFVNGRIDAVMAKATVLATGGAGKVFKYTSNWSGATGDGIAIAWRAGCRVGNMEFTQFHPTCLFHPKARSFLITEAIRGEGGILVDSDGHRFMKNYVAEAELAPRDIVARSIDAEMKKSGAECVFLDISFKPKEFVQRRFPIIYEKCLQYGIDITAEPIPVVPAAHYLCGGILTDCNGQTDLQGLFAIGETAHSGLHGANRLASNSLLECLAISENAARMVQTAENWPHGEVPEPKTMTQQDSDELIVIHHLWDEIRTLMWNYVGIVRTDKRLERARKRLLHIRSEIHEYYDKFQPHTDIMELRNIAQVALLIVQSAQSRKESRGTHYNQDRQHKADQAKDTILSPSSFIVR